MRVNVVLDVDEDVFSGSSEVIIPEITEMLEDFEGVTVESVIIDEEV